MFRKILLLICLAFVVVGYAYPCFVLPFGTFEGKIGEGDSKVEVSVKFDFNGKAKIKEAELEKDLYYKMKGDHIIISEDKEFDDKDEKIKLDSIYQLNYSTELTNKIGMYMSIGIGALSLILILLPNKRR